MDASQDGTPLYPRLNAVAAEQLFILEVGLRELIHSSLGAVHGQRWHKTCLPSDVLEKLERGREAERSSTWTTYVDHHPIYYADFPDLAKVLSA